MGLLFCWVRGEGFIRFVIGVVFWSQLFDNECGRLLIFFLAVVLSAVLNRWYAEKAKSYYVRYGTLQRTRFSMKTHALFLCKCCVRFFYGKNAKFWQIETCRVIPTTSPFSGRQRSGGRIKEYFFLKKLLLENLLFMESIF